MIALSYLTRAPPALSVHRACCSSGTRSATPSGMSYSPFESRPSEMFSVFPLALAETVLGKRLLDALRAGALKVRLAFHREDGAELGDDDRARVRKLLEDFEASVEAEIPSRPEPTPAERAVAYLLDRGQTDDAFWKVMGYTQGFRLLCEAEAVRTGEALDAVMKRRSMPARRPDADTPKAAESAVTSG